MKSKRSPSLAKLSFWVTSNLSHFLGNLILRFDTSQNGKTSLPLTSLGGFVVKSSEVRGSVMPLVATYETSIDLYNKFREDLGYMLEEIRTQHFLRLQTIVLAG